MGRQKRLKDKRRNDRSEGVIPPSELRPGTDTAEPYGEPYGEPFGEPSGAESFDPDPDDTPKPEEGAAPLRAIGLFLGIGLPLAIGVFLVMAGFFTTYQGTAACVIPAGDTGSRDAIVLVLPAEGPDLKVRLPRVALEGSDLASCVNAAPPDMKSLRGLAVRKSVFSLVTEVEGRTWPAAEPADILVPFLLLLLAFPIRNMIVTGSPLRIVGREEVLPLREAPPEEETRQVSAPPFGPPPDRLRGKKHNRSR